LKSCKKLKNWLEYSEVQNVSDTAFSEGKVEGKLEEKQSIAKNMLAKGFDLKTISELTGLSEAEIEKL
jgi:predicted transposase/invertase (TIGR01784 family)